MKHKLKKAALYKQEIMVITALVCMAVFTVSWTRIHSHEVHPLVEPYVFYSDWLSDMLPLESWVEVSGSHDTIVHWLKRIFEREGVPGELVWLAAVESGFNPVAVSSRGAVGLFQLMPTTAERHGMRVRDPDERLLPLRNAQVAARYLAELYTRFEDWTLVLAAYNAGQNRVARLIRTRGSEYDAIAARLPEETRSFVPRVRALIEYREQVSLGEVRAPYRRIGGLLVVSDRIEP